MPRRSVPSVALALALAVAVVATGCGAGDRAVVADITDRVLAGGERGLLGLAFSADGATLYLYWTARQPTGRVTVAAYPITGDRVDVAGERLLLGIPHERYGNHNGGQLGSAPTASSTPRWAITGGYVYRGSRIPGMVGRYVFTDYCDSRLRAGRPTNRGWVVENLGVSGRQVTTFGQDEAGELYVLDAGGLSRLDPA